MEKIQNIKKGNIWLNVFKTDDGQLIATINKTYVKKNGEWARTPFLNSRRGDILDLMEALKEFQEFERIFEAERGQTAPPCFHKTENKEVNTMNAIQVSKTDESWIVDQDLPVKATLKVIRYSDPDLGLSDDEIQDRNEFIRSYLQKDFELLMLLPEPKKEAGFFIGSFTPVDDEYNAFNTHDFQKRLPHFDRYGYAIRKIMERVRDLANLHSSITAPDRRMDVHMKYEALVENQFRTRLIGYIRKYRYAEDYEIKMSLKRKIAESNQRIQECKKIWEQYAPENI